MKTAIPFILATLFLTTPPALAATPECRQALALGLDVSGSVDAREYRLQMDGLAQALNAPNVKNALLSQPQAPIMILIYEWSGPNDQHIVIPWTRIETDDDITAVFQSLRDTSRRIAAPGTALGQAMRSGATYLEQTECWTKTLDISGDGESNLGPRPRDVKPILKDRAITINALAIGSDDPVIGDTRQVEISQLSSYFRAEVILGPDAFVETSLGFEAYAAAMTRKLEREIKTLQVSQHVPIKPVSKYPDQ